MRLTFFSTDCLLGILFSLISIPAFGSICSCERVSLEWGLAQAKHVFEAEVISSKNSELNLRMIKLYRGKFFHRVQLGIGNCTPKLNNEQIYVFYLKDEKIHSQCDQYFSKNDSVFYENFLNLMKSKKSKAP